MSNTEHIVPETVKFQVKEKIYEIGKLSYTQITLLSRFFVKVARMPKVDAPKENSNLADMLSLRESLDDDMNAELLGIYLKEKDNEFIKKEILADGILCAEIMTTVCEANDFGKMFGNFLRAMEASKRWTWTPANPPSPTL